MKVLVFGAQGQLGHVLVEDLRARGDEVIALTRQDGDVTDAQSIQRLFRQHAPDLVFNASAYNAVDRAEEEIDVALSINAVGPGLLAATAREHGAHIVHFSTDYVFGHGHEAPIDESRAPDPLGAYARSKRLGEEMVLANCADSTVIRCCGLYSSRRHNFVRTMIRVALMGKPLTVVSDQFVSPTWVKPLSQVALALSDQPLRGVFHAVSQGQCSWYQYAAKIFNHLHIDADLSPVQAKDWGAAADRPGYSVLDNALLRIMGLDTLEAWDVMLERFLDEHGQRIMQEERDKLAE